MRILIPFILTVILLPYSIQAQEEEKQIKNNLPDAKWGITISPLALFDYSPRYRAGFEYFRNEKWSYGLDLGYGNTSLTRGHAYGMEWADDYQLFEVRPEIKYFFSRNFRLHHYAAFELFHVNATDKFYDDYYYPDGQQYLKSIGYISTDYQYMKTGFDFKYGVKWYVLDRLALEGFVGLGAAQREHRYHNLNLLDQPIDIAETLYGEEYRHEGKTTVFHFSLAFKIGYVFY